jgi:hypothetical protein
VLLEQEVVEEVESLDSSTFQALREHAKNDLYTLSLGILGYPDVNPGTHGQFCRFFDSQLYNPGGELMRFRLGLMPRGHLKSTLGTVADSIRIVLADPENAKVLIANEVATLAQGFLGQIKSHWVKNKLLRALFPELVPPKFAGPGIQWSNEAASIVRQNATSESDASWRAIGVGGAIVGHHFTHIKCDDLIGFEAAKYPSKMQFAIDWNSNIESLLTDHRVDRIDWIGTRWTKKDLYWKVMERYGAALATFTRSAIENDQIIFPQKHTAEEYFRIQQDTPLIWYAQYVNDPRGVEQQDFPVHAVRTFKFSLDGQSVIANPGLRNQKLWRVEDLDKVVLVDPNSGSPVAPDTAAIMVTGVSPDDEVFVLYAWSGRVSPSARVDKIFEVAKQWRPRAVAIEEAGQQNDLHYFEKKKETTDFPSRVVPLKPKNRNKEWRIRSNLEPVIRSGRLHLLITQEALRQQIEEFPDNLVVDELDALAYGPEVWRKPFRTSDIKKQASKLKLILSRRNPRTGY